MVVWLNSHPQNSGLEQCRSSAKRSMTPDPVMTRRRLFLEVNVCGDTAESADDVAEWSGIRIGELAKDGTKR